MRRGVSFAKGTGVILLQGLLALIATTSVLNVEMPIVQAVICVLVIFELIVIFSNLKMRYWFPALPIHFTLAADALGDTSFNGDLLVSATLYAVIFQFVVLIVVSLAEYVAEPNSKSYSTFSLLYESCFRDNAYSTPNMFILAKGASSAILLQTAMFICIQRIFHPSIDSPQLMQIAFALSFAAVLMRTKIRHWILSFGLYICLAKFIDKYSLGESNYNADEFNKLLSAQLLVIFVYFVLRFLFNYFRLRKARITEEPRVWDSQQSWPRISQQSLPQDSQPSWPRISQQSKPQSSKRSTSQKSRDLKNPKPKSAKLQKPPDSPKPKSSKLPKPPDSQLQKPKSSKPTKPPASQLPKPKSSKLPKPPDSQLSKPKSSQQSKPKSSKTPKSQVSQNAKPFAPLRAKPRALAENQWQDPPRYN
jgi:hypothetical protein